MVNSTLIDLLKTKQTELLARIEAIENDFKKGRSQDSAEHTTESENDQVLDEIYHEAKIELGLINQALQRVEQGVYGTCSECDGAIAPERLQALPYVNTCIKCAT